MALMLWILHSQQAVLEDGANKPILRYMPVPNINLQ